MSKGIDFTKTNFAPQEFSGFATDLKWAIFDPCTAHLDEGLRTLHTTTNKSEIEERRRHRELREQRINEWRKAKAVKVRAA
jgi:hypothetical protein